MNGKGTVNQRHVHDDFHYNSWLAAVVVVVVQMMTMMITMYEVNLYFSHQIGIKSIVISAYLSGIWAKEGLTLTTAAWRNSRVLMSRSAARLLPMKFGIRS